MTYRFLADGPTNKVELNAEHGKAEPPLLEGLSEGALPET